MFRNTMLSFFACGEKLFLFKYAETGKKYFAFALGRILNYNFVSRVKHLCSMVVHLIEKQANRSEMLEMLEALDTYVKLAVDVEKGLLAGGGTLHADCEAVLIENGSEQKDVWGADWFPFNQQVTFESLINIRSGQGNFSMEVQDEGLRTRIEAVVRRLMEGVPYE